MKRDMVVFGEDWDGLPSSTQHLIKGLSKSRKIVWVNSIGLRKPKITRKDLSRMLLKVIKAGTTLPNVESKDQTKLNNLGDVNIYPYTLFSIPAPRSPITRFLVRKLLAKQLKPIIEKHELDDPIIWTSLPTASDLKSEFKTSPFVYYCCDDFNGLAGVDHKSANFHERKLVEFCDLLITSSQSLSNKLSYRESKLLTHGVDLELFSGRHEKAKDLPNNGKPTAGFYGSIASWVDIELLRRVITSMPEWNFVFIGSVSTDISPLADLSNTYFVGAKPHRLLPRYSQHWDVSLLPFKNNEQIEACNPLKLKEYMAAGAPIVSTPFPEIAAYGEHISIVNSAEAMRNSIKGSLKLNKKSVRENLRGLMQEESWSRKAEQLDTWLSEL